jgi:hypothetical protein
LKNETILNAFPAALHQEVKKVIEILPLEHNVLHADGSFYQMSSSIASNEQIIILDKESLRIPYRIYIDEPNAVKEKVLSSLQKTILNCIYLRHENGFVRQRRLELLNNSNEYFVIAFVFQLLGEYVMEILEVIDTLINESNLNLYVRFINENPKYWQQTQSRVTSYWDAYYRRPLYPNYLPPKYATRKEYIGQQIVDKLKRQTNNNGLIRQYIDS